MLIVLISLYLIGCCLKVINSASNIDKHIIKKIDKLKHSKVRLILFNNKYKIKNKEILNYINGSFKDKYYIEIDKIISNLKNNVINNKLNYEDIKILKKNNIFNGNKIIKIDELDKKIIKKYEIINKIIKINLIYISNNENNIKKYNKLKENSEINIILLKMSELSYELLSAINKINSNNYFNYLNKEDFIQIPEYCIIEGVNSYYKKENIRDGVKILDVFTTAYKNKYILFRNKSFKQYYYKLNIKFNKYGLVKMDKNGNNYFLNDIYYNKTIYIKSNSVLNLLYLNGNYYLKINLELCQKTLLIISNKNIKTGVINPVSIFFSNLLKFKKLFNIKISSNNKLLDHKFNIEINKSYLMYYINNKFLELDKMNKLKLLNINSKNFLKVIDVCNFNPFDLYSEICRKVIGINFSEHGILISRPNPVIKKIYIKDKNVKINIVQSANNSVTINEVVYKNCNYISYNVLNEINHNTKEILINIM